VSVALGLPHKLILSSAPPPPPPPFMYCIVYVCFITFLTIYKGNFALANFTKQKLELGQPPLKISKIDPKKLMASLR
jgi:hypothetical protein